MRTWPILAVMAFCAVANAQGKDNKAESDKLFNEGITLFNNKDYVTARQKFSDAYGKFPSPSSLFNLARTEQLLDKCPDSISHYRAYLALPDNPRITEQNRANARQDMASCMAKVGRLNVKAPSGTSVWIDGVAAQWVEGEPIDVSPGAHDLQLKNAIGTKTRRVDAPAGQVTFVEWEDPSVPVTNTTNPNTAPIINPTQNLNPNPPATTSPARWIAGGALIGVGVVGLGIGLGMSLASQSSNDEATLLAKPGLCGTPTSAGCVAYSDKLSTASSQSGVAYVGYIAGGVLTVAGVIALLVWPKAKHETAFAPIVTPGFAGASWSLCF